VVDPASRLSTATVAVNLLTAFGKLDFTVTGGDMAVRVEALMAADQGTLCVAVDAPAAGTVRVATGRDGLMASSPLPVAVAVGSCRRRRGSHFPDLPWRLPIGVRRGTG